MSADRAAETLYLVDAYSLIFQVFHAIPQMTSPSGLPTNALFGFTKDMLYLRNQRKPTYLVCCFDEPGPTFRDKLYAEYKAHRAPMPDDLQLQVPLIQQMLEGMRIPVLALAGFEADDLIATLAKAGAERGIDVFICSSDKDCRQLLSDKVKIFNLRKLAEFDAAALLTDWGVRPDQVIDYQTLVGDSVDNVPGAEGVGPKTASKYLQDYGTIENLLAHIDDLKGKKKENLQAFLPELDRSRKLVTLDTQAPMALTWEAWRVQPWDGPTLLQHFRDWGFRGFAEQVRSTIAAAPAETKSQIVQGSLFGSDEAAAAPAGGADWPHAYHLVHRTGDFTSFLAQLKKQKRFAIDLETTSLDPHLAEVVGIAICWQPGEAWYLALRGPAGEPVLDPNATLAQLKPILEDPSIGKVNQNVKYDWQVLLAQGVRMLGVVGDSMVADYLLHAGTRNHNLDALAMDHLKHRNISITELIGKGKNQLRMDQVPTARVAEYAGEDADVAWRLCEKLEPELVALGLKRADAFSRSPLASATDPIALAKGERLNEMFLYDDLEIPLIEVLGQMEFTGVRLDVPFLNSMSVDMDKALTALERDIHAAAGREFNINSVPQLREVLFTHLGFKSLKKTNIGGDASTDQETLELLAKQDHPHVEFPRKLLEHRKIAKLKGTYVDALPALVNPRTGRIHASFNQTVASTGRLSSSEPNLQNIPIRSEMGGNIRRAFLPEEDWLLLAADYSQIELRLLAHFSADIALQQAFADDRDIHALVAAQIFGVELHHVTEAMRRTAKTVNFGVIYGISASGLANRLGLTSAEGAAFIDAYFTKYPRVQEYQESLLKSCRENGYVGTILGRRRRIEGVRAATSYKNRNQPEREAINMQIQGSAADLIKVAMLNIHRRLQRDGCRTRMLLQIHDELVFEVPTEEKASALRLVHEEMTSALSAKLDVPLRVDMSVGPNWHDTSEVQVG
ncbi:MAG: DNA polymerase I [Planctomycetes bacterium]|nr:DNA polymerase I [Planctomycetota bacterium]